MHSRSIATLVGREIRLGYRSPWLVWAVALPVGLTLLVQGVFGSLFAQPPVLGIVDQGSSAVVEGAVATDGIEVVLYDDVAALDEALLANDVDAGLVLQSGFDQAVMAGERPTLDFRVSGSSLATERAVLAVTTLDLVRAVEGSPPPVAVEIVEVGDGSLDLSIRLIPLLVVMAIAVGGAFVPAAGLVQEKEERTLDAVLVTPAGMADVFGSKAILGASLALFAGLFTLVLNDVRGPELVPLAVAVGIGGVMMAELGLIVGAWARDQNTLFTVWKGGAILLIYPVVFFLFPDLPQWIGMLSPTWWFLDPIFSIAVEGATLADVAGSLAVALGWCLLLVPAVVAMGRRLERRVGEE